MQEGIVIQLKSVEIVAYSEDNKQNNKNSKNKKIKIKLNE